MTYVQDSFLSYNLLSSHSKHILNSGYYSGCLLQELKCVIWAQTIQGWSEENIQYTFDTP